MAVNGGEAIAAAMRQIEPEVVAAYPITPQTVIIEKFAEYCADALVRTEFVTVESEHAALSACVGASAAGARVETATAGPGLALMFEILGVASGMRLPIVMHLCTRALSSPINILCDHSDAMAMRESSWVMLSGSSPQEGYDQALIAHKIAEHPDVKLPLASMVDGFIVTHAVERVDMLPDDAVREWVGEYEPEVSLLTPGSDITLGALDFRDFYFEHKRQQQAALDNALGVTEQALREYADFSGRAYNIVEPYRLDDAEFAFVILGAEAALVRTVVDSAREKGIRAGMLRVRLFRPFPSKIVAQMLSHVPVLGVMDRAMGFGSASNPLAADVIGALWDADARPVVRSFVYGLGGRVTTRRMVEAGLNDLLQAADSGKLRDDPIYLGLREGEVS